jgi:hypothetical protein
MNSLSLVGMDTPPVPVATAFIEAVMAPVWAHERTYSPFEYFTSAPHSAHANIRTPLLLGLQQQTVE